MTRLERAAPILACIRAHEAGPKAQRAQGVDSPYDVVWSGIKPQDRPASRISALTVERILWWQDVIDPLYMSEATGAYQFMEDTLRPMVAPRDRSRLFDAAMQDELALRLLDRRGWAKCEAGLMTPEDFAEQLAREWASFPVVRDQTVVRKGKKRLIRRGQSYYAGDGLNAAGATPQEVLAAIHEALAPAAVPQPSAPPEPSPDLPPAYSDAEVAFLHDLLTWANQAPPATDTAAVMAWRNLMPLGDV